MGDLGITGCQIALLWDEYELRLLWNESFPEARETPAAGNILSISL